MEGSVSTTGGTFASGTQVSITATPNAGIALVDGLMGLLLIHLLLL